ncbi:short-chain alcohol dehydrogenase [Medicago truncatula]|uniref:Short-chain alcohol dehydrogenase n=1 Tax=Medicago truncatula TaxID=3880 RepID=G7KNQ0_MEDTR|nr:short-chain alcohol dehydrogenase [Medicago truncatula]
MAESSFTNSNLRLAGKIAIVTGGASSIGKETAHVFVEQGACMVVIADIQDEFNVGIASPSDQTILELDISQADHLFSINIRGMALCVKHAARSMVEGYEVNRLRKVEARNIIGLMRSASVQLAKHGIRVNFVSPNGLATPLTCKLLDAGAETETS